jgi:uncharacterized phage protein (TIGR02220 family)
MTPRQALDLSLQDYHVAMTLLYAQVAQEELSPQEIGDLVGLTASEVGKSIKSLQDMGYYDLGRIDPWIAKAHLGMTGVKNNAKELAKVFTETLNELTGKRFSPTSAATISAIKKLIRTFPAQDVTEDTLIAVVEIKHMEWADDPVMAKYLRPDTLLRVGHFPNYLEQARAEFAG